MGSLPPARLHGLRALVRLHGNRSGPTPTRPSRSPLVVGPNGPPELVEFARRHLRAVTRRIRGVAH
ncbi:hypothetical protein ABTM09_19960, partial [Acinetobacter baumannii]